MIVAGATLDSISDIGGVLDREVIEGRKYIWKPLRELEARCAQLASKHETYLAGESIEESYWRTLVANTTAPRDIAEKDQEVSFRAWRKLFKALPNTATKKRRENYSTALNQVKTFIKRQFCITRLGFMCLVPAEGQEDDLICLLLGYRTPVVIRRGWRSSLIGECYVHGAMEGESLGPEGITLHHESGQNVRASLSEQISSLLATAESQQKDLPPGWQKVERDLEGTVFYKRRHGGRGLHYLFKFLRKARNRNLYQDRP